MHDEQIPLYIGVPLALLCLSVFAIVVLIGIAIWKDHHE